MGFSLFFWQQFVYSVAWVGGIFNAYQLAVRSAQFFVFDFFWIVQGGLALMVMDIIRDSYACFYERNKIYSGETWKSILRNITKQLTIWDNLFFVYTL